MTFQRAFAIAVALMAGACSSLTKKHEYDFSKPPPTPSGLYQDAQGLVWKDVPLNGELLRFRLKVWPKKLWLKKKHAEWMLFVVETTTYANAHANITLTIYNETRYNWTFRNIDLLVKCEHGIERVTFNNQNLNEIGFIRWFSDADSNEQRVCAGMGDIRAVAYRSENSTQIYDSKIGNWSDQ